MNDKVSSTNVLLGIFVAALMVTTLLFGFLILGVGKTNNCWDKYITEREAILNCEGES